MLLLISSFLFTIPSIFMLTFTKTSFLEIIIHLLTFFITILLSIEWIRRAREARITFLSLSWLVLYTMLFLFSSFVVLSRFYDSQYMNVYYTCSLLFYAYALSNNLSFSAKPLLSIVSSSICSFTISLLFFPFSFLLLLLTLLFLCALSIASYMRDDKKTSSNIALQSMLAHEIRTPLTIMQTTSNLLLEEIPGPLNAQQKQFVQTNYEHTQRLISFSENMLTLLKFEKDFELNKKEKINIRIITQDIIAFFDPLLKFKQQSIRYSLPSLLSSPIGDESLIRQVFMNLIHNAIKHTSEGGYIVVSVTQDDNQLVVNISDNGIGVQGDGRENLFKEFYQEESQVEQFKDGFGLGLSIVRRIIEKHGGQVYITSVKNKGTIVSFTLPAKAIR